MCSWVYRHSKNPYCSGFKNINCFFKIDIGVFLAYKTFIACTQRLECLLYDIYFASRVASSSENHLLTLKPFICIKLHA